MVVIDDFKHLHLRFCILPGLHVHFFNEAIDSSRYSKENPRYKEMKKTYPFLASATLTKEEEAKYSNTKEEKKTGWGS